MPIAAQVFFFNIELCGDQTSQPMTFGLMSCIRSITLTPKHLAGNDRDCFFGLNLLSNSRDALKNICIVSADEGLNNFLCALRQFFATYAEGVEVVFWSSVGLNVEDQIGLASIRSASVEELHQTV